MKTCKICPKKLPKKSTIYCSRKCYGISQSEAKRQEYQFEKELRKRIAEISIEQTIAFERVPEGLSERQAHEQLIASHNRKNRHVRLDLPR